MVIYDVPLPAPETPVVPEPVFQSGVSDGDGDNDGHPSPSGGNEWSTAEPTSPGGEEPLDPAMSRKPEVPVPASGEVGLALHPSSEFAVCSLVDRGEVDLDVIVQDAADAVAPPLESSSGPGEEADLSPSKAQGSLVASPGPEIGPSP